MCPHALHALGNTVSLQANCNLHLNGPVATLRQYHITAHRATNKQNLWSGHNTLVLSSRVLTGALTAMQSPELDDEQLRMHSVIRSLLQTKKHFALSAYTRSCEDYKMLTNQYSVQVRNMVSVTVQK